MTKIKRLFTIVLVLIMMLNLMACVKEKPSVDTSTGNSEGIIRENTPDTASNQKVEQVIPATSNTNTSSNSGGNNANGNNNNNNTNNNGTTNKTESASTDSNKGTTTTTTNKVTLDNKLSREAIIFDTDSFVASVPEELKGTTLTFLNWYDTDDRIAEKENIEAFERATGINVNVIGTEYNYYTDKLVSLVATGDAPDVIRMSEPRAAWMKYLQPIENTGYNFSDKAWNPEIKDLYSVNGIQYAANLSYTPFIVFSTIHYYADELDDWGFEDPWELWQKGEWTWEKLREMSEEWIKQGPDYYGLATVVFEMPASTRGLDFVSYDGSQWNMDLYDSTLLNVWRDIIRDRENRITIQGTYTTFGKAKHKALFSYCDSTSLEASSVYSESMKKRGVWGVAPAPKYEGEDYYVPLTELIAFGVPRGAKNKTAVPYFISWYGNLDKYDVNTFFYNDQARAVFEEMVAYPNRHLSVSSNIFNFDNNPFVWNIYNNATSYQLPTFIQSQEYDCLYKLYEWNLVLYDMDDEIN